MAVRRRPVLVEFEDRFGEKQIIHRGSGSRLQIRRKEPTVALALAKSVGAHIGQRIKDERLKAGMSMPSLANRSGLRGGKQVIYSIEQGLNVGVRIGTLYALAVALNVSPFSLMPSVSVVMESAGVQMQNGEARLDASALAAMEPR